MMLKLRSLNGQQNNHQISLKLFNMIFFNINCNLVKKNPNILALLFDHFPTFFYRALLLKKIKIVLKWLPPSGPPNVPTFF